MENISRSQRTFKYPIKESEDENGKARHCIRSSDQCASECLLKSPLTLRHEPMCLTCPAAIRRRGLSIVTMDLTALQVVIVDVRSLGRKSGNAHRKLVVERALRTKDQDNETFYSSLRARMQRSVLHHDLRSEEQLAGINMQPAGLNSISCATS